jgi:hypothetical protein
MVTAAQVRTLALSFPEAEASQHFDQPDFRVRGKIFATLDADGKRGTLKLSPELQAMVLDARPEAFFPAAGYWGRQGWTNYHPAKVQLGELTGLMEEAWLRVAPKRLAASRSSSAPPTRTSRAAAPRSRPSKKKSPPSKARTVRKSRSRP